MLGDRTDWAKGWGGVLGGSRSRNGWGVGEDTP